MSTRIETRHPVPPAPVHPLAALVTVLLDNAFGAIEILDPLLVILTSLTVATICSVTVLLIQRYLAKEDWGVSVAKGMVMGIVAGVPFPVTGTAIGVPLLAWSGLHEWIKAPMSKEPPTGVDQEYVDAEFREVR